MMHTMKVLASIVWLDFHGVVMKHGWQMVFVSSRSDVSRLSRPSSRWK